MGENNPWVLLLLLGGAAYAAKLWCHDFRAARSGLPSPHPLPGATPASRFAIGLAVIGAVVLLAAETAGEYALGLVEQQSRITVLFGGYTLAAAFLEELIFRGFVVIEHRGRAALVAGVIGASLLFALLHPFLWQWENGQLTWQTDAKAWFSTGMVFGGSLWFYAVRFWKLNPTRSLLPCMAAHATKNLGVFLIKYAQGFVDGWW
ncbi:MAG: CPBP family intramembrane metalloprotease [Candidatus Didemnitutus sp.]|nr:CPBP family intramembrane metalloprotease [Candidatus Didemnitutus sp.]